MKSEPDINETDIDHLLAKLNREAEVSGYHLNPDLTFTRDLVRSLLINEQRFGYPACPCRLALGDRREDLDIICPCDYRDQDITEYGACYCGLYVSEEVKNGSRPLTSIPERRPSIEERQKPTARGKPVVGSRAYPVWRCKVCGYLCAREKPPATCPICHVAQDRFEPFL